VGALPLSITAHVIKGKHVYGPAAMEAAMPNADDHAQTETERKRHLFAWADRLLKELGLTARVAHADLHELQGISLDVDSVEVAMAIRDALHPASGTKAGHFVGLREGALKKIIKARFAELKRDREGQGAASAHGLTPQPANQPNPADLVHYALEKYVELSSHQYVAVTLWILHSYVYDRFMVSPRLACLSPVRGCGKTTLLDVAEQLTARGHRTDSITAAAIYHFVDTEHATLLLDEADNLDTAADKLLRAVLNGGHRRGAKRVHMERGKLREFSIFAPMALAAIGTLPLPLLHRSILIEMRRASRKLTRWDANDFGTTQDLFIIRREIEQWASAAALAIDPPLPATLRNRPADNWRPLIAIADVVGGGWGEIAREAAVALSKDRPDEDPGVVLLTDIRDIFDRRRTDRLASQILVADLNEIEDGLWSEWRGPGDDQQPRRLSQGELARMLRPFGIKPRTVWPIPRTQNARSAQGYYRVDFERAWTSYCPPANTATHASNIKWLGQHMTDT
jgi:hypothetical protein